MTARQAMKDQGVKIMLDRERTFKFDLNALCALEEKFEDIQEAFEGISDRNFKKIRSIVHALLIHEEDDSFTEKDAGALIGIHNIGKVAEALAEALKQSSPEVDGSETSDSGK